MLFGEFLNQFAAKAGIPQDDADLAKLLSVKEIATTEIPESIVTKLQTGYMTVEAAKNNKTVRDLVTSQFYDGLEAELTKTLDELGIDETIKTEIFQEKKNKKVVAALKKIQELESKKASGKGDKAELQKEIDRLQGEIKTTKSDYEKKLADKEVEKQTFIMDHEINSILSQYNYALPKDMDAKIKIQTARLALNEELKKRKGKTTLEEGAIKLINAETGADYYDEKNNKLDLKSFADSVMAQYKLLAVNGAAANQTQTATVVTADNGSQGAKTSQSWDSAINEAKKIAESQTV